jgi:hypothetical protein
MTESDADTESDAETEPDAERVICSARGCTQTAVAALRWNNPKIHPPERRKTWVACADHTQSLSDFLAARGFLRETDDL